MSDDLKGLTFKATVEEVEAYDRLAFLAGHSNRSRWIRDTLNAATSYKPLPLAPAPPVAATPQKEAAKSIAAELLERAKPGECPKRLPKGTYCKSCGRTHA